VRFARGVTIGAAAAVFGVAPVGGDPTVPTGCTVEREPVAEAAVPMAAGEALVLGIGVAVRAAGPLGTGDTTGTLIPPGVEGAGVAPIGCAVGLGMLAVGTTEGGFEMAGFLEGPVTGAAGAACERGVGKPTVVLGDASKSGVARMTTARRQMTLACSTT
jgi:hypothetical protein